MITIEKLCASTVGYFFLSGKFLINYICIFFLKIFSLRCYITAVMKTDNVIRKDLIGIDRKK